jgi:hypothetical protein
MYVRDPQGRGAGFFAPSQGEAEANLPAAGWEAGEKLALCPLS